MPRWRFRCRPQGAAPPVITNLGVGSVEEGATLSFALTANESVSWAISGGADAAKFEISGSTLRWASNGTKDYSLPDDAGANNVYNVTVQATSAATGKTATKAIAVTVVEVVIPPPTGDLAPTVSVKTNERKLLNLDALASVPDGNNVELVAITGTGKLNLVSSNVYRDGDTLLSVGSGWNGTAESGFASWTEDGTPRTAVPADETRTTAKPIARLLTPGWERIAGDKTLVVDAIAKGGIANVRFYCEGAYVDVTEPRVYYYTDVNGIGRQIEGYCCTLDHSAIIGQHASGNTVAVFVRITATDGTMQTRLLGSGATNNHKIRFFPESTAFAHRIDLTPSQSPADYPSAVYPSPRARFQTLDDCLKFVKGLATQGFTLSGGSPVCEIVCTETTTQAVTDLTSGTYYHPTGGQIVIRAEASATLTITCTSTSLRWEPRVSGLVFRGSNVVLLRTGTLSLRPYLSTNSTVMTAAHVKPFWYDGCTVTTDRDYQQYLLDNGKVSGNEETITTYDGVYGNGWYVAMEITARNSGFPSTALVRNCSINSVIGDMFSYCWALVGTTCNRMSKSVLENGGPTPAFSVVYSGAASYARVVATGSTNKVSLQTSSDGAAWTLYEYSCSTYQRTAEMVAAINADTATHGFTATSLVTTGDNFTDRNLLGMTSTDSNSSGLGSSVTLKSAGVDQGSKTLYVYLQLHSDLWDAQDLVYVENILIKNNIIYDSSGYQPWFMDNASQDIAVVNNHLKTGGGIGASIQDRAHSHHIFVHNNLNANFTIGTQTGTITAGEISGTTLTVTAFPPTGTGIPITTSSPTRIMGTGVAPDTYIVRQISGTPNRAGTYEVTVSQTVSSVAMTFTRYSADEYCELSNNLLGGLTVSGAAGQEGFTINNNTVTSLAGVSGTGNATGSPMTTLVPNDTGNPEPDVTTPTATPFVARDVICADRPTPAPRGAKALRATSATLTKAQALDLAVVNLNETAATGANVVNIRWKESAGNAGSYVNMTLTLDAVA